MRVARREDLGERAAAGAENVAQSDQGFATGVLSGFAVTKNPDMASLKELADKMIRQVIEMLEEKGGNGAAVQESKVVSRVST